LISIRIGDSISSTIHEDKSMQYLSKGNNSKALPDEFSITQEYLNIQY